MCAQIHVNNHISLKMVEATSTGIMAQVLEQNLHYLILIFMEAKVFRDTAGKLLMQVGSQSFYEKVRNTKAEDQDNMARLMCYLKDTGRAAFSGNVFIHVLYDGCYTRNFLDCFKVFMKHYNSLGDKIKKALTDQEK